VTARTFLRALVVPAVVVLALGCGREGPTPTEGRPEGALETEAVAPSPPPEPVEGPDEGRRVFAANCTRCHGDRGLGDGPDAASLYKRPANLQEHVPHHSDADLAEFIRAGSDPMPAFEKLSEEDLEHLLAYLRTLAPEH
jgi:mono/diheme cytochrome c family protein